MLKLAPNTTIPTAFLSDADWAMIARGLQFSPRELQIVRRVFFDEKDLAIAARLDISAHTVHSHLKRIYEKLGVRSRVELIVRVFREYIAVSRGRAARPDVMPAVLPFKSAA